MKKRGMRLASSFLAILMAFVFLFAGCGGSTSKEGTEGTKITEKTTTAATTEPVAVDKVTGKLSMGIFNYPVEDTTDPATNKETKGIKTMVKPFLDAHPKLALEFVEIPAQDANAKFQTLLLGGTVDALLMTTPTEFYNQGLIVNLKDRIEAEGLMEKYTSGVWTSERFISAKDGGIMALPVGIEACLVSYDKQVFLDWGIEPLSDVPTLEEVLEKAAKITGTNPKTGKQTYGLWYDGRGHGNIMLDYFTKGLNIGKLDMADYSKIEFTWNTPEIKAAILKMVDATKFMPPGFEVGQGMENWGKAENNVGICMLTWAPNMQNAKLNNLTDRFVATKGLRDSNGKTPYASSLTYVITKSSKNVDAAWELIKFMAGPDGQKHVYENFNYLSSWKGADWIDEVKDPYAKQFMDVADHSKNIWFTPFMFSSFRPWLGSVLSKAVSGEKYDIDKELADQQDKALKWVEEQKQKK
jgi:ABC-type glycerol-3-phosphate transport system substrate-binding protein